VSDLRNQQLSRIERAAAVVELRMRIDRAVGALPVVLTFSLAVTAAVLVFRKLWPLYLSEALARQILVGAGSLVLLTLFVAMLRRLPPRAGTIALDRHHGLHDRLTSAIAFRSIAAAERTALMEVAIDDACEHASALRPAKAAPIHFPADLPVAFAVAAGVVLIALFEVRTPLREMPVAKTIDALPITPDDLELFRDAAKELERQDQTPEVKAAIDKFNQLIEDIAHKRLDRNEAFRRMESIERELLKGAEADRKALADALKETAEELDKNELTRPLGESLKKQDLQKAQKDLADLADRLRDKKKKLDKGQLEKLRAALQKASERRKEALAAINEKRSEIREDLLKEKNRPRPDGGAPTNQEEDLLRKKERELERLDREAERQERMSRQLDRLDRELAKAAEDLLRDLGMSAEDLEQAAEDLNRMQDEAMSDKEKEELRQRLEELREILRQGGQGGKQRMARMLRFGKRARGGSGQQGQGQEQQGQGEQGEGQQGEGQEGEGNEGDGKNGQRKGQGQGEQWVIGPGGKKILIPGMGQGQGESPQQGGGQGQEKGQGGDGTDPGGKGIGSGHDGNVAGKRTDPKMGTQDVQAQGLDSQEGSSNSQAILGAAQRGFKGSGYKKVFTQYHTVAEEQINKDQIPDGYRFYVNRYFQLIRPRE
jgi:hypothetical protein